MEGQGGSGSMSAREMAEAPHHAETGSIRRASDAEKIERQRQLNREAGRRMRERRAQRLVELEETVARLESEDEAATKKLKESTDELRLLETRSALLEQRAGLITSMCFALKPTSELVKTRLGEVAALLRDKNQPSTRHGAL